MIAIVAQHLPVIEWMLKTRADIDLSIVDCKGRTALWHAASAGNVEIIKALIQAKASVNSPVDVSLFIKSAYLSSIDIFSIIIYQVGRRNSTYDCESQRPFRCSTMSRRKSCKRKCATQGMVSREMDFTSVFEVHLS